MALNWIEMKQVEKLVVAHGEELKEHINENNNGYITKEELTEMLDSHFERIENLVKESEKSFDLKQLQEKFQEALKKFNEQINKHTQKVKDGFNQAKDFVHDNINQVKESANNKVNGMVNNFNDRLKDLSASLDDKYGKYNHKIRITSLENEQGRDSEEIAQIVMTNGVNGKEYALSVWAGDIEKNELEPYYVYLNNPQSLSEGDLSVSDSLYSALHDSTLSDVIKMNSEVEQSIQEYFKDESKTFSIEIPKNDQNFDLHELIVDEEVADLLLKNEKSMVSKQDLIDFGRLVEGDKHFSYNLDHELNESFQVMLNQTGVKKDEVKYLNTAFNTLNVDLDANDFSKNKSIEKANEPEMTL